MPHSPRCPRRWPALALVAAACTSPDAPTQDAGLDASEAPEDHASSDSGSLPDARAQDSSEPRMDATHEAEVDADGTPDGHVDTGPPGACADGDGDGFEDATCGGRDCDDDDAMVHPDAVERCGNGRDDDCNAATADLFDGDGDGHVCSVDCDDTDAVEPGADGSCDGHVYYNDFEADAAGWQVEGGRTQGTLDGGEASWELGTPAGTFIHSAASGERAWVTNLTGDYQNDEASYLVSPRFDFSALQDDPVLSFSHVFDVGDGDFHGVSVRVGNGEWRMLGTQNTGWNWHAHYYPMGFSGLSSADGSWRTAIHRLTETAGQSSVQIRFELSSDVADVAEGVGVDDVRIEASFSDLAIVEVAAPVAVCANDADWLVTAYVANVGNQPVADATVRVQLQGAAAHDEPLEAFAPGELRRLELPVGAATPVGSQTLTLSLQTNDDWPEDDVSEVDVQGLRVFEGADYFEDFEAGPGGWVHYPDPVRTGWRDSWEWGEPGGDVLWRAASGTHAFVTGLAGSPATGENSYLQSPCFDLSALADDPWVMVSRAFDMAWDGINWVEMQLTTDGGAYWQPLFGTDDPSDGWYLDFVGWVGHSDPPGHFRAGKQRLEGAAGARSVSVRFVYESDLGEGFAADDVQVASHIRNLEVREIDTPRYGCEGRTGGAVQVAVHNNGTLDVVGGFELSIEVDSHEVARVAIADTVLVDEERVYALPLGDELAGVGRHLTTARLWIDDDRDSDDALTRALLTQPRVDGLGYVEDFETDEGDWSTDGQGASWQWGEPDGSVIHGASSGSKAWVTNLRGTTPGDEDSSLLSPCFDLSGASVDPILRFDHFYDGEPLMGPAWVELSVDGGQSFQHLGSRESGLAWYDSHGDYWDWATNDWFLDEAGTWRNDERDDAWLQAQHPLTGAAGRSGVLVRMRFYHVPVLGSSETEGHAIDHVRLVAAEE